MLKDNFPDRFKKARSVLMRLVRSLVLKQRFVSQVRFPGSAGYGVKAVSREGTERLMDAAITFALDKKSKSVTLVHKGAQLCRFGRTASSFVYALLIVVCVQATL